MKYTYLDGLGENMWSLVGVMTQNLSSTFSGPPPFPPILKSPAIYFDSLFIAILVPRKYFDSWDLHWTFQCFVVNYGFSYPSWTTQYIFISLAFLISNICSVLITGRHLCLNRCIFCTTFVMSIFPVTTTILHFSNVDSSCQNIKMSFQVLNCLTVQYLL